MLSLEEIRKKLHDRKVGIVAESTGLTVMTVQQIRDGTRTNPKYATLSALSDYFENQEKESQIQG